MGAGWVDHYRLVQFATIKSEPEYPALHRWSQPFVNSTYGGGTEPWFRTFLSWKWSQPYQQQLENNSKDTFVCLSSIPWWPIQKCSLDLTVGFECMKRKHNMWLSWLTLVYFSCTQWLKCKTNVFSVQDLTLYIWLWKVVQLWGQFYIRPSRKPKLVFPSLYQTT